MNRVDFNSIILRISRKLFRYAYRVLNNQQEAEDAVQEVCIKLWEMRDRLNQYDSIEALSTTMIRNHSIDLLRRRKAVEYEHINTIHQYPGSTPSPQEQMERKESYNIISEIIEKLPPVQCEMIRLRDIDGLTYDEISAKTNQTINNIRVILSRARKSVRNDYKKYRHEK
ncbi:MAG: sigma-70 family RNA polymerase sigma factor [Bacteroidales bacterium]|nr:sigma-70 family RNA polymerase sigma factor [Bacteroidales bacterium]